MTAKYYFRNLALQDFGYPADTLVIEFQEHLKERLSNLKKFTHIRYPNSIFYGKSKNEIMFAYTINGIVVICYDLIHTMYYRYVTSLDDIIIITQSYISDVLQFKVNYTHPNFGEYIYIYDDFIEIDNNKSESIFQKIKNFFNKL